MADKDKTINPVQKDTTEEPKTEKAQTENAPKNSKTEADAASEKNTNITASTTPDAASVPAVPVAPDPNAHKGHWYVIHTYSGHENKAASALKQRIETMGLTDKIFEVVVPTRNIVQVRHGKKEEMKEKIFPGYMLVRMSLDDQSWLAVRTTQGVTGFVAAGNKPTPISEKEVEAIMRFMKLEAPKFKAKFTTGEAVKIVDGPFADFLGTVESIDEAKGKVKVLVSIFGRETPVELDFLQVAKL